MNIDTQALMMGRTVMVILGWLFVMVLLRVAINRTWQFYIDLMLAVALREEAKKWQANYPTRKGMT